LGKKVESVPKATQDALMAYDWPGNIRELQNVLMNDSLGSVSFGFQNFVRFPAGGLGWSFNVA
jgi:transcriptional regulator with GAF, ATPase, and Fis domain